jgi:hypothetical protein
MKLDISSVRLSAVLAISAVLAMSAVTVSTYAGAANGVGSGPVIVANRHPSPPSTPQIPSAAPVPLQPAWSGKGWPGMGPFHGGGWPGQ